MNKIKGGKKERRSRHTEGGRTEGYGSGATRGFDRSRQNGNVAVIRSHDRSTRILLRGEREPNAKDLLWYTHRQP